MSEIVLASGNIKKIAELGAILRAQGITILPRYDFGIDEPAETGTTFVENALIKARHATKLSTKPAIADDSGLVVPSLSGAPGVYSSRYAGCVNDDHANNIKLIKELETINNRHAYFVCVIVYLHHANDPLPIIAQGLWHGEILRQPVGDKGFGYDPLFWLAKQQKSAAQLNPEVKNTLSHRAQALAEFKEHYLNRYF